MLFLRLQLAQLVASRTISRGHFGDMNMIPVTCHTLQHAPLGGKLDTQVDEL